MMTKMNTSTPKSSTRSKISLVQKRGTRLSSLFKNLSPLPKLVRDLFVLSFKVTFSIVISSIRLVIPPSKKSLLGETVLITSAGSGIGRELAQQLAKHGCIVVCWDTNAKDNLETLHIISEDGGEAHGFVVDVSKRIEVQEAMKLMRQANIPDVSILINNTTVLMHSRFLDYDTEDVQKIFDINVLSKFWTIQAFLPSMLENKKGHVVSIFNTCELYGALNQVISYSANFAGRGLMEGLMEELRLTVRDSNVNFTTVYPFNVNYFSKGPKSRFPNAFDGITPNFAAEKIIRAMQRNYVELTIPSWIMYLNTFNRILPKRAERQVIDFFSKV